MKPRQTNLARRRFLGGTGLSLGAMALRHLAADEQRLRPHAARTKNIIYVHLEGAPPTCDMFDRKPMLDRLHGQPCPEEFLKRQRFAFIKGRPNILGHQHGWLRGSNGIEICELFPHLAQQLHEVTLVRSMVTDQFNHAPAEHLLFSGAPRPGRPSLGSWVAYGLGSDQRDLPAFVVMVSGGSLPSAGKALWGAGFLPSSFQGCEFRTQGDPVLYLQDPPGYDRERRARALATTNALNGLHAEAMGDPETLARISQFELAFRMQAAVPEAVDLAAESAATHELYGSVPGQASFANHCLLARRLVERGVRFVQLFDAGWDIHGTGPGDDLMSQFPRKAQQIDRALAALLADLRRRGLLEETLVVIGGEFGRTPMNEARDGSTYLGRDHNPHAFAMLLAGGGCPRGAVVGATDEFGYRVTESPIHVHDLQATILHLLGLDHERLTYPYQGRQFRLTDVHGRVRRELLA